MEAFEEQFEIDCPDVRDKLTEAEEIAAKLYQDTENVLMKKMEEFGAESYLRLFRNTYLQEIDKQWIEHLQAMDRLRDGTPRVGVPKPRGKKRKGQPSSEDDTSGDSALSSVSESESESESSSESDSEQSEEEGEQREEETLCFRAP